MPNESNPEQPQPSRQCHNCGAPVDFSARICPACGQVLYALPSDVNIGGWISAGWQFFIKNIGLSVALSSIVIIFTLAYIVFSIAGFFALVTYTDPEISEKIPQNLLILLVSGFGVLSIIGAFIFPALNVGIYACFLDGIRTGKLTTKHFWAGFRRWWACTWIAWVYNFIIILFYFCCCFIFALPILLLLFVMIWLAYFRIADKATGGFAALSYSFDILRGRFWMMLFFTVIVYLIMNVGNVVPIVGGAFSLPVGFAAFAAAYNDLNKKYETQTNA